MAANAAPRGPREGLKCSMTVGKIESKWKTERQMRKGWTVITREPFHLAAFNRLLAAGLAASAECQW